MSDYPESFIHDVNSLLDQIVIDEELPEHSLYIYKNKGKNGNITSLSIVIHEPEYPVNPNGTDKIGKNAVALNMKKSKEGIELIINKGRFNLVKNPGSALSTKTDDSFAHTVFSYSDDNLIPYIKDIVMMALDKYESSNSFACCSRFVDCSDAKKCVHPNKLYARGCSYFGKLKQGIIYYGKNRTI